MFIKITREKILPVLATINGVVERRQTLPILGNVLIKIKKNNIFLIATDLEVEVRAVSQLMDSSDGGEVTLPAKKFYDICKALPEGAEMEIRIEKERALIRSGHSQFTLGVLPAEDYPSLEMENVEFCFKIHEALLKRLLENTAFSMAQQDVRYYLNGVLLELSAKKIRCVATDGHRLALCEAKLEIGQDEMQVLLPRKAVLELIRLLNYSDHMVSIDIGPTFCRFNINETVFITKLIEGKFPDYDRVIPRNLKKSALLNSKNLKSALVRASILSSEKYKAIRMTFSERGLLLQSHSPEQEEAEEEMQIKYEGEDTTIGFNVAYLYEILGVIDGESIAIDFLDGNNSAMVRDVADNEKFYIIMPMKI